MICGTDKNSNKLWEILNLDEYAVGRFRDCYLGEQENVIIVLIRNGGGNREDYQYCFDSLQSHPYYDFDQDCDWDETYAEIYFNVPNLQEKLK